MVPAGVRLERASCFFSYRFLRSVPDRVGLSSSEPITELSECPDQRHQPDGHQAHQQGQGYPDTYEVRKPVTPHIVNHQIGLIADGCGETGRRSHHDGDGIGYDVHVHVIGRRQGDGKSQHGGHMKKSNQENVLDEVKGLKSS